MVWVEISHWQAASAIDGETEKVFLQVFLCVHNEKIQSTELVDHQKFDSTSLCEISSFESESFGQGEFEFHSKLICISTESISWYSRLDQNAFLSVKFPLTSREWRFIVVELLIVDRPE